MADITIAGKTNLSAEGVEITLKYSEDGKLWQFATQPTRVDGSYSFSIPKPQDKYTIEVSGEKLVRATNQFWENQANPISRTNVSQSIAGLDINYTPIRAVDAAVVASEEIEDSVRAIADGIAPQISEGVRASLTGTIESVRKELESLNDFALLTESLGDRGGTGAPSGGGGPPPGGSLSTTVQNSLREVLGWKARSDDPKGFLNALANSFAIQEVEGTTKFTWTPRTYAVLNDLAGGVTGAQASIYTRAADAIEKAKPLLEGLYPLRIGADKEDMEALKTIIDNEMTELVGELGRLGGPRIIRVDQLFDLLLGSPGSGLNPNTVIVVTDPDKVAGHIGILRRELGLSMTSTTLGTLNPLSATLGFAVEEPGGLVNTVEEEQNLTNYRILADYLTSLRQSWETNKPFFSRQKNDQTKFLGTQLVLLSRDLSVVAESVNEVRLTFDTVFIGPAEREVLEVEFGGAQEPMFVEEVLSWIYSFATQEGPALIQDGGKFGVGDAFRKVAEQLRALAIGLRDPANLNSLPRGYQTARVRRALDELARQLGQLVADTADLHHEIPAQEAVIVEAIVPAGPGNVFGGGGAGTGGTTGSTGVVGTRKP